MTEEHNKFGVRIAGAPAILSDSLPVVAQDLMDGRVVIRGIDAHSRPFEIYLNSETLKAFAETLVP